MKTGRHKSLGIKGWCSTSNSSGNEQSLNCVCTIRQLYLHSSLNCVCTVLSTVCSLAVFVPNFNLQLICICIFLSTVFAQFSQLCPLHLHLYLEVYHVCINVFIWFTQQFIHFICTVLAIVSSQLFNCICSNVFVFVFVFFRYFCINVFIWCTKQSVHCICKVLQFS